MNKLPLQCIRLLIFAIALQGCGGDDDDGSDEEEPNTPPSNASEATATMGTSGGTLSVAGVGEIVVPQNAFFDQTVVTVRSDTTENSRLDFEQSAQSVGVESSNSASFVIELTKAPRADQAIQVTMQADSTVRSTGAVAAFAQETVSSDDEEKGESHIVVEAIDSTGDTTKRVITLPTEAFLLSGTSKYQATLRLGAIPAGTDVRAEAVHVRPLTALPNLQCNNGTIDFAAPMLYGWRRGALSPSQYYEQSRVGIVGAFNEGREGHPGHQGIDFFADIGTPVYAVGKGRLKAVQNQNYTCGAKPTQRPATERRPFPDYFVIIALTDENGKESGLVTYRHLSFNTVSIKGKSHPDFATCWRDGTGKGTFEVERGERIASTGNNGTLDNGNQVPPHLHLEWSPNGTLKLHNPMCKLATNFNPLVPNHEGDLIALYGNAAPGQMTGYSFEAATDPPQQIKYVDFSIRRVKPSSTVPVCRINQRERSKEKCDLGGRGYFTPFFWRPAPGFEWNEQSDGELARVDFESSYSDLKFYKTEALKPRRDYHDNTITFFDETFRINDDDEDPYVINEDSCGWTANVKYGVSVPYNRTYGGKAGERRLLGPPATYTQQGPQCE